MTDINIAAQGDLTIGEFVGRDKITNNIQNIQNVIEQRALTAAESLDADRAVELKALAEGVRVYVQRLQARASEKSAIESEGSPYKGLLAYRLADAELFFGRTSAMASILKRLLRGSFTVLHSESGAGKSSILQAGLSPRLIAAGHLPVYIRPYNVEPSLAIKRTFLADPSVAPLLATGPLRDFLQQVTQVLGPQTTLYIFLDQFEEFFTQLEEPARPEFVNELAECLDDTSLNVRWLVGMRTEFFGNLAAFRPRIPNPFENDYRLNRLTRAEAVEVITEPAARRGVQYEPGLVDKILDDLAASKEAGSGADAVSPPEIQLVCSALYEALKPGDRTITNSLYTEQDSAAGILRGHLDRVLSRDLPAEQRPLAQALLEALITSDNRRVVRPFFELVSELAPRGVTEAQLKAVLEQLVDSHLLHVEEKKAENANQAYELAPGVDRQQVTFLAYELAHDYLLGRITVDPTVQARKAAQELLAQEVQAYQRHGTLLSDDKLAILLPRKTELALSPDAQTLLRKSEQALRRRRGMAVGGIGLVLVLVAAAAFSLYEVFQAQSQLGLAVATQQAAVTAQQAAVAAQNIAATQVYNAAQELNIQQALSNAAAESARDARLQQATSQAAQVTAQAAAEAAATREAAANAVFRDLFESEGLLPVVENPWDMIFDGELLWVVSRRTGEVEALDPVTGFARDRIRVGAAPRAVEFDGERIWVSNYGDGTVSRINRQTYTVTQTYTVGANPVGMAFDGERLWVALAGEDAVRSIDVQTGELGEPIKLTDPAGKTVGPWKLAFDGQRLWVANFTASTVQAIDPATGTVFRPLAVGQGFDDPIDIVFDGTHLWVANFTANTVQIINPVTYQAGPPIGVGVNPYALEWDGEHLWVVNRAQDTVVVVDANSLEVSAPFKVGDTPTGLAHDNTYLWVTNSADGTVQAIDPQVGNVRAVIQVGQQPNAMVYADRLLWVANTDDDTVQAINPTTGEIKYTVPVGDQPMALAYGVGRVWVANYGDDTLQAISVSDGQVTKPVLVGDGPSALAFTTTDLWIANANDNTIRPYDFALGGLEAAIPVGESPQALVFDGRYLWIANTNADAVQWLDLDTLRPSEPIAGLVHPTALASDGRRLWVANTWGGSVQSIELSTFTLNEAIFVGAGPSSVVFDGARLWVTNQWASTVQSLDLDTLALTAPVPVEVGPRALVFDGQRVWFTNAQNGTIQAIEVRK